MAEFCFSGKMTIQNWPYLYEQYRKMLDCTEKEINIDVRQTVFWEPFAVGTLAAVIRYLQHIHLQHRDIHGVVRLPRGKPRNYLKGVGFLKMLGGEPSSSSGSATKLNVTEFVKEDEDVLIKLQNIIVNNTSISDSVMAALYDAFGEIMVNVCAHARSPVGGIAVAQVYPRNRTMRICFADMGIGIRESFRGTDYYQSMSNSHEAIMAAMQEFVTSAPDKAYQGMGLPHVKEFVKEYNGVLTIVSQEAMVRFRKEEMSNWTIRTPIPGTVVNIFLNLSTIARTRTTSLEEEVNRLLRDKQ